jgi:hypothetical protein
MRSRKPRWLIGGAALGALAPGQTAAAAKQGSARTVAAD